MINLVYYFEPEWAFGSIHYEQAKYLFVHGINAHLLSWEKPYTHEEINELVAVTDVFMSCPQGYRVLVNTFGIPSSKVIVVAHAAIDIQDLIEHQGPLGYPKPKAFGVVSKYLGRIAKQMNIPWEPILLPLGVNMNNYNFTLSQKLETVGYAGSFRTEEDDTKQPSDDLSDQFKPKKRGHLVEECARQAGLNFKVAEKYHNSFITMPGFYNNIDCVIVASTGEGAGLPAIEAGAAGRLVISTPVGHWPERVGKNGGHSVSIEKAKFIDEAVKLLKRYKKDSAAYQKKCQEIKKHAKSYDWNHVIQKWVDVISV